MADGSAKQNRLTYFLQKRGVCVAHGARAKRCSHEGCAKQERKEGLCHRHGVDSLATAHHKWERPPQPVEEHEVTLVTSAIERRGGEIKINPHNLEANMRRAAVRQSPLLHPSIMDQNFSDDNEKIGALIWRTSRMARLVS